MSELTAEIFNVNSFIGNFFTAKVYVPMEGYVSMDKLYFNGNTKTEAKQKAKAHLKQMGYKIKFV
jgi:hypothetical protein